MTLGYKKLQQRQKYLEHMLNKKMSNDIHNIQQILNNLTRQNNKKDHNVIDYNIIEGQRSKHITNKPTVDSSNMNNKINPESYASMLMYNSY